MRQELATTAKATDPDGHFEAVGDPTTGATFTSDGVTKQVLTASATTGATDVKYNGTPKAFQITGSSTFSCSVLASLDGVNFVAVGSAVTTNTIVALPAYRNATWRFNVTSNAGTVSVTVS